MIFLMKKKQQSRGQKSDMVPGANVESMQRVRPRYRLLQRFCFFSRLGPVERVNML